MSEFQITFTKGTRIGARSHRTVVVEADSEDAAIVAAKAELKTRGDAGGYRLSHVYSDAGSYDV